MTGPQESRERPGISGEIRRKASEIGFDAVGVTVPDAVRESGARLERFLELGRHGDMAWMAEKADRRRHPNALWPEAASVIMLGLNYGPPADPLLNLEAKGTGNISVYARNRDYHDIFKKRLKELGRWMVGRYDCEIKVFVDTAPVMEKPLAAAAGLGWQGKHSNLVSRDLGSWLFLGALFTTLKLEPDPPHPDNCGDCRRCLDICPTNAFPAPYELDARRCISYLTIEYKGHIPLEFRVPMGNRIYGCDDCLAVCPWNKFARKASEIAFFARAELQAPPLGDLVDLNDAGFRALFRGSPIKRTGYECFLRNVLIAIGNSGLEELLPQVIARLDDPSALLRAMAVWAFGRLARATEIARETASRLPRETDDTVRAEWLRLKTGD